ncbi:hypothetical protein D1007_28277 [Hordeum vulgare]|nr:hypothetical protein D1007_28277 [Hordeum vulgare]
MPAAAVVEEVELPSCIALRSQSNGCYLRYVHEHGETYRQLQLNGKDTINPYTRYDVQVSRKHNGLVHIRCRYNRKYWVARRRGDAWCIAADADEPEEDLTNPNCTLIKPIVTVTAAAAAEDGHESAMTVRFVGAGDGKAGKATRRMTFAKDDAAPCMRVVEATAGDLDHDDVDDAFTVLNLVNSARMLPKFVMFKGNNDLFLVSRHINNRNVLEFAVTDIGDGSARFELFPRNDGSFCIATHNPGQGTWSSYWNLASGNWIEPNILQNNAASNRSAWFQIHQVNDSFAIRSVSSGRFCKRFTGSGFTSCLNAADTTITAEARVVVEEPILHREIHSISYRLDEARVYDTTVLTMATTAAVNDTSAENTKRLRLVYEEEEMSTWDATLELKLGYNSTIRAGFPKLGLGAQISISAEFYGEYNWGQTMEKKVRHEVEYEAAVPPRTKVTVMAIATRSTVDVPFTYWQRDVTIDGKVEETLMRDGLYTGINSYNFNFDTVEEKLPERIPLT